MMFYTIYPLHFPFGNRFSVFEDAVRRNAATYRGKRINIGISADHGARIQHRTTAYFHMVS